MEYKPKRESFMQIKFEGQSHCVDANTLITVLGHYQYVINEANRQYGGGAREISLQINAIERGSFVIDITPVQTLVQQIFSKDAVEYAAALCSIIGGVYGAYKILKGRPAKTPQEKKELEDAAKAAGNATNINVAVNIYNTPSVREAISKSIEEVSNDASVEGLSINTADGKSEEETITFERKDFASYIYDDFDKEEEIPDERIVDKDVTLVIVGLNFETGSRWQFMYEGFKIQMTVKDDALMKKIDEGERFGKGDAIRVKMRIVQRYNKLYKAYENKSYKILEFYKHIIPPTNLNLFDNEKTRDE